MTTVTSNGLAMTQSMTDILIQQAFTAIIMTDNNYRIEWVNMACEQMLGISVKHLKNTSVCPILSQIQTNSSVDKAVTQVNSNIHDNELTTNESIHQQFDKAKTNLQSFVGYDRWIGGIKQPLFVDYSVTPIQNDDKLQFLIEVWFKGRHHRIAQEHQDQRQYTIAKNMLRSVAHEVKNPLAGIRGAAQLLQRKIDQVHLTPINLSVSKSIKKSNSELDITLSNHNKINTYCDIIISETDRLDNLIKQLLTKQPLPNCQPLNLHIPIDHVLTLAHSQNPTLKIIRDYDLSLPELLADKDQLIQAFLNLTTNAIESMSQQLSSLQLSNTKIDYQPQLTVSTRVEFQYTIGNIKHKQVAKISITDNGTGIDGDLISQIFFPLVTGRVQGTGLGLSIVQDIIHRHNGQIEVESYIAYKGSRGMTTFSIYLPFQ